MSSRRTVRLSPIQNNTRQSIRSKIQENTVKIATSKGVESYNLIIYPEDDINKIDKLIELLKALSEFLGTIIKSKIKTDEYYSNANKLYGKINEFFDYESIITYEYKQLGGLLDKIIKVPKKLINKYIFRRMSDDDINTINIIITNINQLIINLNLIQNYVQNSITIHNANLWENRPTIRLNTIQSLIDITNKLIEDVCDKLKQLDIHNYLKKSHSDTQIKLNDSKTKQFINLKQNIRQVSIQLKEESRQLQKQEQKTRSIIKDIQRTNNYMVNRGFEIMHREATQEEKELEKELEELDKKVNGKQIKSRGKTRISPE